jgi:cytochrome c-type biogenesis protein CcmH
VRWLCVIATSLVLSAQIAGAVQPDEMLGDPRCMVCQNQSIDDSEAPLARDLRVLVRERIRLGDSDQKVIDFLVARYGQFVLLRPRLEWHTALLWFAPLVLLIGGAIALIALAGRRKGANESTALSAEEEAKLARLISKEQPTNR